MQIRQGPISGYAWGCIGANSERHARSNTATPGNALSSNHCTSWCQRSFWEDRALLRPGLFRKGNPSQSDATGAVIYSVEPLSSYCAGFMAGGPRGAAYPGNGHLLLGGPSGDPPRPKPVNPTARYRPFPATAILDPARPNQRRCPPHRKSIRNAVWTVPPARQSLFPLRFGFPPLRTRSRA
jgi:hypothetical protein